MDAEVSIVDTTLRDGQMSLWASGLATADMLPVADAFDTAGFRAVEILSNSFFKKCARDLGENLWMRLRLVAPKFRRTPLRAIRSRHLGAFQISPWSLSQLWMERLAAHGIRQIRISDPANDPRSLARLVAGARAAGLEAIVNLIYSVSPKHTDAYYQERARAIAALPVSALCLKDPGGLLTPTRTRSLVRYLCEAAPGKMVEIHGHCNNGLGPLNALAAVEAGARVVNTAIAPLAEGPSLPDVERTLGHLRGLGYAAALDLAAIQDISRHLRRVALRQGWPEHPAVQPHPQWLRPQVPGGMVSHLRAQLATLGLSAQLPAILDEIERVRADLGYPIMVTPYSQFVGAQAALNVLTGQRYRQVADAVIQYALGLWGEEEAAGIDDDIRDRILSHPRAKALARAESPAALTLQEVRRRMGLGPAVDDDELLLRYMAGSETVDRLPPASAASWRIAPLVRWLAGSPWRHMALSFGGYQLTVRRGPRRPGAATAPAVR